MKKKPFRESIDGGVKLMSEYGNNQLMPHFIYCKASTDFGEEMMKLMFLSKMKKYGIPAAILTVLTMSRKNLITKEKQKEAFKGKLYTKLYKFKDWENFHGSINDDLELFLDKILKNEKIDDEMVRSFLLPKLTDQELKIIEDKDEDYLKTFSDYIFGGENPDVDKEEMKKSNSKDKYVHCRCWRRIIKGSPDRSPFNFQIHKRRESGAWKRVGVGWSRERDKRI